MNKVLIFLIKFYKKHISLFLKKTGVECKYYPSCSKYSIEAIKEYGAIKGTFLSIKRILRCNPFSKGGYDPLK